MVRPRTPGSSRLGRSPFEPSTLPDPGPSEPVITVKGRPVFARNVPEMRHPSTVPRIRRLPEEESGSEYWNRTITAWDWSNALGPFRSCATGSCDWEYPWRASSPAAILVYALRVSIALLHQ